jgi:BMFP domain-containing protein YqiC
VRVKISYGVELDQIPEEVQKLFDSVMQWQDTLSRQSDTIDDLLATEEFDACVSVMEKMRMTLGKMDSRLSDLSSILEGYDNYIKQTGVENELSTSERRPVVDTASSHAVSRAEQSDGSEDE